MLVAGGQVTHHLHVQLLGAERRGDVQALGLFRQAEQVEVVVAGAEGGGEQRGAVGVLEARAEEGRRQDIADAQGRVAATITRLVAIDVEQRVRAEAFCQAAEQHGVHIETEQLAAIAFGLVGEQVGDGADCLAQGGE